MKFALLKAIDKIDRKLADLIFHTKVMQEYFTEPKVIYHPRLLKFLENTRKITDFLVTKLAQSLANPPLKYWEEKARLRGIEQEKAWQRYEKLLNEKRNQKNAA